MLFKTREETGCTKFAYNLKAKETHKTAVLFETREETCSVDGVVACFGAFSLVAGYPVMLGLMALLEQNEKDYNAALEAINTRTILRSVKMHGCNTMYVFDSISSISSNASSITS